MGRHHKQLVRYSSTISVLFVFMTIVLGGYVSSVRAGLACPDWPLCPPLTSWDIVIEFTHRVWSAVTGLVVLATAILAATYKEKGVLGMKLSSVLAIVALIVQVTIGMFVIKTGLNPEIVTLHLSLATLVFGFSLATAVGAWRL